MRSKLRNAVALAILATATMSMTSCSDMMAKNRLQKSTTILNRMTNELNGELHAKASIDNIRNNINKANQELTSGQSSIAKQTASSALTEAEQTLIAVLSAEANKSFNDAIEEIRVGDINNASRIEPQRYQTISDLKTRMDEQRNKNDNEAVINTSRQIITEMKTLLNPLDTKTKRAQSTAETKLQDLKGEGGQTYAPEIVIAVQDTIGGANKIASLDRDYGLATIQFEDATRMAEAGIEQVKRARCDEQMTEINSLLATALLEGAKVYVPEQWANVERLIDTLIADFNANKYGRVLLGASEVKPKVEELVFATKKAAADARIATMDANIRELSEGGARQYLPGRTEELEAIVAEAKAIRAAETLDAFDQIKSLSLRGIETFESIERAFDTIALENIRIGSNALETTTVVFGQMGDIFDPITGEMSPDQKAFEAQKSMRSAELGQELSNARKNLQDSFLNQKDGRYRDAILLAQDVKERSEGVLNEVYHVVGHNAAIELANLITRYERDGAREYSKDDLDRSQAQLESVKTAITEGRYRESVSMAAEARANVELMAQGIAGRATVDIRDARVALRDAQSELTRKYRGGMLDQVNSLITSAENDLAGERLKSAVERAREATVLARRAQTEAYMTLAQENIDRTKATVAKASDAGAELYAGRELSDARNLLSSAQTLFLGQDYEKASSVSQTAAERADSALYKKVIDAESAVASARAVGGWEYDAASLGEAGAKIRQARQEIDSANYQAGGKLAVSARSSAESLSDDAKDKNFHDAVSRLNKNLSTGTTQGINFFQPEESAAIRTRLFQLENMYSTEKYDLVMSELSKLEGRLRGTLDTTGETVHVVADQQETRLNQLIENGARGFALGEVEEAKRNLDYARMDYRRGLYKSAHSSLQRAIGTIDEIANRRDKELYSERATELMARYGEARSGFSKVLNLGSRTLKDMAVRNGSTKAVSISTRITASEFREEIDRVYSEAVTMTAPKGYEDLHVVLIDSFSAARIAAVNFQKMAAYDVASPSEVESSVDEAYRQLNRSSDLMSEVQARLHSDARTFRDTTQAVGMVSGR
jgi:hypothetical protein